MDEKFKHMLHAVAIGVVAYQMVEVVHLLLEPWDFLNAHLTFALILAYLPLIRTAGRWRPLMIVLLLLSVAATGYMQVNRPALEMRQGFPTAADSVAGTILIVCILEACRRTTGPAVPMLALLFILYALIGVYLPAPLHTSSFSLTSVIAALTTNLTGVYGLLLEITAYYIFLFVVMGGILQITAANNFFIIIGALAARLRGGPAMSSVVTSALVGTTLGSTDANVALTGSFTIPLMKKSGYAPYQAGAIESAASNGGMIMPPVMGAAAFVMADFIGVPYFTIVVAAIVPAILYFCSVGLYVYFTAVKMDLRPSSEALGRNHLKQALITAPGFLAPLVLITFLLSRGYSPRYAAFWAVVTVIIAGLLTPGKRPSLAEWARGITTGTLTGASISISIVSVAMVVEIMTLTGLGFRLPGMVQSWSQGNLGLALVITAAASLILGMGVPPAPAYLIVAITAAPVLVRLGVPLLTAHLFVFYYAVMSMVTPPVAPAAVVGARLAEAGYFRTSFEAAKAASAGFLVPFIFVASPIFIFRPEMTGIAWTITSIVAGLLMIVCVQAGLVNCLMTVLRYSERVLFLAAGACFFLYLLLKEIYAPFLAGIGIFVLLIYWQLTRRRIARSAERPGTVRASST
jgi:TRAP transporter 4TM/12TM fusion protein